MKEKRRTWIPVLVILAALLLFSAQAGTAEGEETAERTAMFYLCGSDLESNYEYATVNLEEILSCGGYGTMNGMMFQSTLDEEKTQETTVPEVRVVLETGGCRTSFYNIPVQINGVNSILRCVFNEYAEEPLSIDSIWQGYNQENGTFSRNIMPLAKAAGREYCLLYPIEKPGHSGKTRYETSQPMPLTLALNIEMTPLKPGTYFLKYLAEDIFMRLTDIGSVRFTWDGERAQVAEGAWEGVVDFGGGV